MLASKLKKPLMDIAVLELKSKGLRIRFGCHGFHTAQWTAGAHFDRLVPGRQPFQTRHIGPSADEKQQMLKIVGCKVI